jgi:hypothetical protein
VPWSQQAAPAELTCQLLGTPVEAYMLLLLGAALLLVL